jgi:hypothetical protein
VEGKSTGFVGAMMISQSIDRKAKATRFVGAMNISQSIDGKDKGTDRNDTRGLGRSIFEIS